MPTNFTTPSAIAMALLLGGCSVTHIGACPATDLLRCDSGSGQQTGGYSGHIERGRYDADGVKDGDLHNPGTARAPDGHGTFGGPGGDPDEHGDGGGPPGTEH